MSTPRIRSSELRAIGSFLSRDSLLVLSLSTLLLISLLLLLPFLNPDQKWYFSEYWSGIILLLLTLAALLKDLSSLPDKRERHFWIWLSAAYGCWLAVQLLYAFTPESWWSQPFDLATEILYGGFYALFGIAIVRAPRVKSGSEPKKTLRLRERINSTGIVLFAAGLLVYLVIIPGIFNRSLYDTWVPSLFLYVLLDLGLVVGFSYNLHSSRSKRWFFLNLLFLLTAISWAAADLLECLMYTETLPYVESGESLELIRLLIYPGMMLASRLRHYTFPEPPGGLSRWRPEREVSGGKPSFVLPIGIYALILPSLHFVLNNFSLLDSDSRLYREIWILAYLMLVGGISIFQQIHLETDRRKAEAQVSKSRRLYKSLADTIPLTLFESDSRGRLSFLNGHGLRAFGYTRLDLKRKLDFFDLFAAEQRTRIENALNLARDGDGTTLTEMLCRRKNGSTFPAVVDIRRKVENRRAAEFRGFLMDITQQRALEEQLRQSQKMESIGLLAGGVSHDFNNILTGIIGHAEILKEAVPNQSHLSEHIEEIMKLSARAAELTRQLLAFSRKQTLSPRPVDLNALVEQTSKMLRRLIGENIELAIETDPDLAFVNVDPGQLEQVLMNLALNARDAMSGRGVLTIQTGNRAPQGESPGKMGWTSR